MAYGGYEDNGYYAKKAAEGNARRLTYLEKEVAKRDVIIQKLINEIPKSQVSDEDLKEMGVLKKMLKTKPPKKSK